jgi:diguanylate cyclase (GGDEF)-like protein
MFLFPLRRLIVPLLLLAMAAVYRQQLPALQPAYRGLMDGLPYLTLGMAAALAVFYNRGRLVCAILSLLLAYWLISTQLQNTLTGTYTLLVYSLLSAALPATLLLLLILPERGLRSYYGWLLASLPLLQFIAGWLLPAYLPEAVAGIITGMPLQPVAGYYLSWIASGIFAAALLLSFYHLCRRDSEYAAAIAGVLLFTFVTLAFFNRPLVSVAMFSAAGVALLVSLLRSSHELAYRDELTGLRSRRALNERLRGLGRHYTIAMLDVDHFKKFNDNYGHEAGDEVLKMVASRIAAVRGGGTAYRYGGEEFCIVFAGKQLEHCLPHLEAVRAAVEEYELTLRDHQSRPESAQTGRQRRGSGGKSRKVSVTISIGAAASGERYGRPADVLEAADAALYKAKGRGRNRIVAA